MSIPRPLLTVRLLRATRVAGVVMIALVLLHYVGLTGTPPPALTHIALYFVAGAVVAVVYAAVDWWRLRGAGPGGGNG